MTDDEDIETATARSVAEFDQAQTAMLKLAETCALLHKTLTEGGVGQEVADAMVSRWWAQFCGPSLGVLLGGGG